MSVDLKTRLITAEEFANYPASERYDLVRGELVPMPPPAGAEHGSMTLSLSARASVFVEDNDLGKCFAAETGFVIEYDPDTVSAPDWAFVAKDRLPSPLPKNFLRLAPDLILEVRSPSETEDEAVKKMEDWQNAGVRMGWELNLKKRVLTIYRPNQELRTIGVEDTIDGEDMLPGFTLPMRRLFPV